MTRIVTGLAVSADGYIAGPDDRPGQPLGVGGERLFDWYSDGDTPSQRYPSFRLSAKSAAFFDEFAGRFGSVITGRRTYDITSGWNGKGPLPGVPLFIMTHQPPDNVPDADPPYTFITSGVRLLNGATADLRCTRVVDAPGVTHLTYEVVH